MLSVGGLVTLKYLKDAVLGITLPDFKPPLFTLAFIFIVSLIVYFYIKWTKNTKEKEEEAKEKISEAEKIRELLRTNINSYDAKELNEFIEKLKEHHYLGHADEVKEKLADARSRLRVRKEREELYEIQEEKQKLKREVWELDKRKYKNQKEIEKDDKSILDHLEIDENTIFLGEDLDKREKEVLENNGFEKINTYDSILEENKDFFVKKVLDHSAIHTFLVERTKQLLEQYISSKDIKISQTKEADIIFKIENKKYAFEIEIGSLLEKKKRLKEKVEDLNQKFKNRWYFIVPNRNLMKKYRKYGKCTLRSGVRKIIDKLANSEHPILGGAEGDLSSEYF